MSDLIRCRGVAKGARSHRVAGTRVSIKGWGGSQCTGWMFRHLAGARDPDRELKRDQYRGPRRMVAEP